MRMIILFDTNGDGKLNTGELARALDTLVPPRLPSDDTPAPRPAASTAAKWIKAFDVDNDRTLSPDELNNAIHEFHPYGGQLWQ